MPEKYELLVEGKSGAGGLKGGADSDGDRTGAGGGSYAAGATRESAIGSGPRAEAADRRGRAQLPPWPMPPTG